MVHFFALMLWGAGGLALLAGMPELGIAIFVVIVVNGLFAFAQESRAERAAARLQDLLPRRAVVVRDGARREIDAAELVVGDLVVLAPGDRVSADLVVGAATRSPSTRRRSRARASRPGSTEVTRSRRGRSSSRATVRPRWWRPAARRGSRRSPVSPEPSHDRAVRSRRSSTAWCAPSPRSAVGVGGTFLAISLLIGTSLHDGFLFAIGVTVALVPEGLLPTVTLSLAVGAQRMAERHALVRRLEAVETLGSTTVICTDKTGTLTQNQMTVLDVWTPDGPVALAGTGYEPSARVTGTAAAVAAARRVARPRVSSSRPDGPSRTTERGSRVAIRWRLRSTPWRAASAWDPSP